MPDAQVLPNPQKGSSASKPTRILSSGIVPGKVYATKAWKSRMVRGTELVEVTGNKDDVTRDYWRLFRMHLMELLDGGHLDMSLSQEDVEWLTRHAAFMEGTSTDDPRKDAPKYIVEKGGSDV